MAPEELGDFVSESRTGGPLDLQAIRAELPGGSRYRRSLIDAEANVVRLIHEVESLRESVEALRTALRPHMVFFQKCWFAATEGYAMDGGEVQDWGEELGLLVRAVATQACGENCLCAEHTDDWPTDCYRLAPMPDVGVGAPERDR